MDQEFCIPFVLPFSSYFFILPSVELEDVIAHIKVLIKFTQQALNDSNQAINLLNSNVFMMRKAVLQNSMALNILNSISRRHQHHNSN